MRRKLGHTGADRVSARAAGELRRALTTRGWSGQDLVDKIQSLAYEQGEGTLGLTRSYVSEWLSGKRGISRPYARRIGVALDIPAELFIDRRERSRKRARAVKRRDFVKAAGMAGFAVLGALPVEPPRVSMRPLETHAFLDQIDADIRSSWTLMAGNEVFTAEAVLLRPLLALEDLLRSSSGGERSGLHARLRRLATEGNILAALAAILRCNYTAAVTFNQRAVEHSRYAQDMNLHVAALKHLATRYQDVGYPLRTVDTYREALQHNDEMSPLLRSRTHLGLALASATLGDVRAAHAHLRIAEDGFPSDYETDPAYPYSDCGPSSLSHYGGLIRLKLGDPRGAWETFDKVNDLRRAVVPERTSLEILNCQAEAAVSMGDLDMASDHVEEAVLGSLRMESELRFQEARGIYARMQALWPGDPRVRQLEALFHR